MIYWFNIGSNIDLDEISNSKTHKECIDCLRSFQKKYPKTKLSFWTRCGCSIYAKLETNESLDNLDLPEHWIKYIRAYVKEESLNAEEDFSISRYLPMKWLNNKPKNIVTISEYNAWVKEYHPYNEENERLDEALYS